MKVTVKLFAFLRKDRFKINILDFPEETSVLQVLDTLSITVNERNIGILFINGRHARLDSILKDGDVLAIFPQVAGG